MEASNYELMLVAVSDRADQLLTRVEKSVKEVDAVNLKVERLGKKQLAYQIKKQTDATYFVINFEASPAAAKPIWDKLRLEQEDLLRYMLLKKVEKKASKKSKRADLKKAEVEESQMEDKPKVTVAVTTATAKQSKGIKVSKAAKASKGAKVKSINSKSKKVVVSRKKK